MDSVVNESNTEAVVVPKESTTPSEASPSLAVEVNSKGEVDVLVATEDHGTRSSTVDVKNITPASDLSIRVRQIWIVTTAALPWRTGTAVNPLLRALSLLTYPIQRQNDDDDDKNNTHHHVVTLMIPWLESTEARKLLYGTQQTFANPAEQEAWIRNYCITRCNATPETTQRLQIQFWKGIYQESFGSIFPVEDICQQIPKDQADVCILEEPEHLNWFRNPYKQQTKDNQKNIIPISQNKKEDEEKKIGEEPPEEVSPKSLVSPSRMSSTVSESSASGNLEDSIIVNNKSDTESVEILGWAQKFRHVVGVLHTNYGDYIRQYAFPGISAVTAPALNSLSSLVVKAYCHRVIRLSATLPHLDKTKEITCNVHGVRHEFFLNSTTPATVSENEDAPEKIADVVSESFQANEEEVKPTAVYFIGKLIWAKGFEKVLEVEEKFKIATGDYFEIDIYGSGKDEKEIQKAFFGKHGKPRMSKSSSSVSEKSDQSSVTTSSASRVFSSAESLRKQLCGADESTVDDENVVLVKTEQFSGTVTPTAPESPQRAALSPGKISELLATPQGLDEDAQSEAIPPINTNEPEASTIPGDGNNTTTTEDPSLFDPLAPLDVLGEVSEKTISTSVETADAAMSLIECVVKAGFGFSFENNKSRGGEVEGEKSSNNKKMKEHLPFHLAPAKSRFKVRQICNSGSARLHSFF
jgi:hypothetical protein